MFVTERRRLRLALASAACLVLLLLCVRLAGPAATETLLGLHLDTSWLGTNRPPSSSPSSSSSSSSSSFQTTFDGSVIRPAPPRSPFIGAYGEITGFAPPTTFRPGGGHPLHTEIFSATTKDRRYFRIRFGAEETLNPNILPHPQRDNTWTIVAQRHGDDTAGVLQPSVELACDALFVDGQLTCIGADGRGFGNPWALPIRPTAEDTPSKCVGELEFFSLNVGPHDARVFYGPDRAYVVYGSNSRLTCFGQWIRDFGGLVASWGPDHDVGVGVGGVGPPAVAPVTAPTVAAADDANADGDGEFDLTNPNGTELQRPSPTYGLVEKNWFLFWDAAGNRYVHFDITPTRSFAELHGDGSVGKDLALRAAQKDNACLARYLPRLTHPELESVHQATNSLSVTLCRRADPHCTPSDGNTFIIMVFHHKTYFRFHAMYHPYVMVFRQRAPFEVWAVSMQPIWISGRTTLPMGDTEMFYVTSMSWRAKGQRYHGYVDDVLFLAFGIEDRSTGGIDVLAGDLLANLGLC